MYKFLRATLWTVVLMLFGSTVAFCATTDFGNVGEPSYKLVHTLDSSEVFVATYDVTDYGAVADGQTFELITMNEDGTITFKQKDGTPMTVTPDMMGMSVARAAQNNSLFFAAR